jgi:hypothetical protein
MASSKGQKKVGQKRSRDVEKELDAMSCLAQEALDAELQYIQEQLRQNAPLAYTLASLMREDKLAGILQRRSKIEAGPVVRKLKPGLKKWRALPPAWVKVVLTALEPDIFHQAYWAGKVAQHEKPYDLIYFALNVGPDSDLPKEEYPQIAYQGHMVELCKARYAQMGSRLSTFKNSEAGIKGCHGYFAFDETRQQISCALASENLFELPFSNVPGDAELQNCFHQGAKVVVESLGCNDLKVKALCVGVDFPSETCKWELPGVTAIQVETIEDDAAGELGSSAASSASSEGANAQGPQGAFLTPVKKAELGKLDAEVLKKLRGTGTLSGAKPPPF